MFYSALDLRLVNPGASDTALNLEQSARQSLINDAVSATELLINSVRAIKPYDDMGNVELTVPQIEDARAHALLKINNLLEAIAKTNQRVNTHRNSEYQPRPAMQPASIWPPDQVASVLSQAGLAIKDSADARGNVLDLTSEASHRVPTPADVAALNGARP